MTVYLSGNGNGGDASRLKRQCCSQVYYVKRLFYFSTDDGEAADPKCCVFSFTLLKYLPNRDSFNSFLLHGDYRNDRLLPCSLFPCRPFSPVTWCISIEKQVIAYSFQSFRSADDTQPFLERWAFKNVYSNVLCDLFLHTRASAGWMNERFFFIQGEKNQMSCGAMLLASLLPLPFSNAKHYKKAYNDLLL